ncbi:hypothetical protein FY034_06820 [Trichlorobacter lovleyi]|uniref:hypothetical protein n=1 Tax=Trichlorobacter lovleyi TaxID=313985 RepID=UPI00223EA6CE|nr:hypothetical protein [Trichlorobacter lovleyi]QOX78647.1 hypothetical protein FY034_06820 [Trichlorobacter lovleyi]
MSEYRISYADLSGIQQNLGTVNENIVMVGRQVDSVQGCVQNTKSELDRLKAQFEQFVAEDSKAKALQLAETRVVKIRQELETTFGYYAEVRRHTTGILQAADVSIVRQETITTASEELMLKAPRYWLAPALVALSGWMSDNRTLADKALAEALKRDDEKSSLFFALVCRRAGRQDGCRIWLDRYFGMQNPTSLDRQTVVLIDALASGVFGAEVRSQCTKRIEDWIAELALKAGFVDEQRRQWTEGLQSKTPTTDNGLRYRGLQSNSPTWPVLNQRLNDAAMHKVVLDYFAGIYDGVIPPAPSLQAEVDNLLTSLVSNFDDEELPLRRDERLNKLIIEEEGDKESARKRHGLETTVLTELVSFTQLLTNAAMHPETSHASRATQRFALALSRDWIREAHQDLTGTIRAALPQRIELEVKEVQWKAETAKGDNEQELVNSLQAHIEHQKEQALSQIKVDFKYWAGLAIGIGFLIFGLPKMSYLFMACGAAALIWFYVAGWNPVSKAKQQTISDYNRRKEQATQVLKGCLAEVVEWWREFRQNDSVEVEVVKLLATISPEQYLKTSHDTARQVMTQRAA